MHTIWKTLPVLPLITLCACMTDFGDQSSSEGVMHPAVSLSGQLDLSKNRIMRNTAEQVVTFQSASDMMDMRHGFSDPLPDGAEDAENVVIHAPVVDNQGGKRVLALTHMLRGMGLSSTVIHVEPDEQLHGDAYRLDYTIARVTPPPCPDWSSAPTGSSDNAPFSNLGCATATNIGQMAANPANLEGNNASTGPDPARVNAVIDLYKSGADMSVINSTSITSGAGPAMGTGVTGTSTYGGAGSTTNNSGTAATTVTTSP